MHEGMDENGKYTEDKNRNFRLTCTKKQQQTSKQLTVEALYLDLDDLKRGTSDRRRDRQTETDREESPTLFLKNLLGAKKEKKRGGGGSERRETETERERERERETHTERERQRASERENDEG